jgi:type II secretory pathway pseudopilin PulG
MEIMIVMAIIALLFAATFKGMSALNRQQVLQEPFDKLRSLAKTAWQRAMHEQRAWQIVFYPGGFELQPRQAVNADDQRMFMDSDRQKGRGSGIEPVALPDGVMMEVRRWGQRHWFRPAKDMQVAWVFEHSGLCEPISVRFSDERSTIGAQFDPLTASVKDEINERDE